MYSYQEIFLSKLDQEIASFFVNKVEKTKERKIPFCAILQRHIFTRLGVGLEACTTVPPRRATDGKFFTSLWRPQPRPTGRIPGPGLPLLDFAKKNINLI